MTIGVVWSFDRRKVLLFLLGILPPFNLTVAAAASFLVILLGRVLRGVTIGALRTIAGPLRSGPQAGFATAIILSGVSLGTVAGVPAGALVSELLGWPP